MEPKLKWLQMCLDLDTVQLKRMVVALTALLIYSIEDNLAPKLDWLQDRLTWTTRTLKKMVLRYRQCYSLQRRG